VDLTAGQRKAVFGLIVVVLVGLGVYMFVPGARGSGPAASPSPPQHSPAAPAASPAAPAATSVPVAAGTPSAPDIYQWLPFTQSELATAASDCPNSQSTSPRLLCASAKSGNRRTASR